MHRFYAPVADGLAHLSAPQLHQIRRVLRLRAGEEIAVFDGSGEEWIARFEGNAAHIVRTAPRNREPAIRLTLFQALIRPARFEWVVQKGVELGVFRFVPFVAERTVASGQRPERWRAAAVEAAEQSGRRLAPEVTAPCSFPEALDRASQADQRLLAWEASDGADLASAFRPAAEVAFIVGPEGGFSEREVTLARDAGVAVVSLGPRILRAETAAIAGAAILMQLSGELRTPAQPRLSER